MASGAVSIERAVAPLDRARRGLLLRLTGLPALGPLLARRDDRVLLQSIACVVVAFVLTLLCPGIPYVLGPALFGVAHVASDARYLALRRGIPRAWGVALVVGCVALFLLRVVEAIFPGRWPYAPTEVGVGWTWAFTGVCAGAAAGGTRASARRAWLIAPVVAALGITALSQPPLARLVFAHLHNLVAIGLWLWLFRRRRRFALPAVLLLAVTIAFFLSGAALPHVRLRGPGAERFVDEAIFGWPRWMPQGTALSLGLLFVFLQSVHYAVWLALIPQDDVRGAGTISFRMSLRSLGRDLPLPLLALTVVAALVVLGASFVGIHRTRQIYLSLASFHGYLELGAGAFLIVRGK